MDLYKVMYYVTGALHLLMNLKTCVECTSVKGKENKYV
jgi:hypothetical protein